MPPTTRHRQFARRACFCRPRTLQAQIRNKDKTLLKEVAALADKDADQVRVQQHVKIAIVKRGLECKKAVYSFER